MPNRFAHTELSTTDVAAAKDFYTKLFDWKLEDVAFGGATYTMVSSDGHGIGGMQAARGDSKPAWLPYVEVADVRVTLDQARAAGATVVVDYQELGANGAMAIFLDPTGAALGIWAPSPEKSNSEKAKRKEEKRARKALERAEEKQAKVDEKQAKKARKAAKKAAKKAREEAKNEPPAIAPRPRSKRPVKKKATTKAGRPAKRRATKKR